jgi:hypothetical protein
MKDGEITPRAVIRVYNAVGHVIETHEPVGEFKEF